jgi:hypothetical protein
MRHEISCIDREIRNINGKVEKVAHNSNTILSENITYIFYEAKLNN